MVWCGEEKNVVNLRVDVVKNRSWFVVLLI